MSLRKSFAGQGARGRLGMLAALLSVALAAGCANEPPPPPPGPAPSTMPTQEDAEPVPQVTPQPRKVVRLGDDIPVRGKVEVVVDPLVDQPTRDLAARVLRTAGAEEVRVREPGPPDEDTSLRVRIGHRTAPGVVKGLQDLGFGAPSPLEPEGYVLAGRDGSDLVLGANDSAGAYYAVQTLRQLTSPGRIAGAGIVDEPLMPLRGSIEGFYGSPWTHAERMDQLAFYGAFKLNTYIYAPKDDPFHRERWRDPYPPEKLAELRELMAQAGSHHVRFTFALSPGTSICYSDPADVDALIAKMRSMYDAGVRDFSVPLDDISYTRWNCSGDQDVYGPPDEGAAGQAQADLLNRVQHEFIATHDDVAPLQMVPTEYSDMDDSAYKTALRTGLDPNIRVMWTGDGVIPEQITVADGRQAAEVWGRKLFLWDNYPVNDFDGSVGALLLGPYDKREPGLHEQLDGVVVNPMNQAAASKVVEIGAADFAWNDEAYDPMRAWRAAAEHLAGDRFDARTASFSADPATVEALLLFFDLEYYSPLPSEEPWQGPAPGLAAKLDEFRTQWDAGDRTAALAGLREHAQAIANAPERIREGAAADFTSDAGPWLRATDLWGDALLATVDALEAREAGDQVRADERFAAADRLADRASRVRTTPGETRPQGPVKVAEGVLDVFIREAPELR
ncbi:beta-N-acetylhexosaminidase family protein [Parasphingorhabdus pacifica]